MKPKPMWGVKCLTAVGWYGVKKPNRYVEAEARRVAQELNEDPNDKETWEAQEFKEESKR